MNKQEELLLLLSTLNRHAKGIVETYKKLQILFSAIKEENAKAK